MPELKKKTPIVMYNPGEPAWMDEETTFKVIGKDPILCTSYDLALRVGEVGFLRRRQYNPDTGDIVVTRLKHKGHPNTYTLRIESWCLEILNRYLHWNKAVKDVLFPIPVGDLQKLFTNRTKARGLKGYTFQSLRHSKITHEAIHQLEEKGVVDELSLSKFAGHLRVETTRLYVHLATKYLAFGRKRK